MLTTSEIFEEYAKCVQNPVYAIGKYLKTYDKTNEGFVPFKLFPKQQEIVWAYEKHRYNLVTKPRQAGISTTTQAYMAIKVAFADPNNPETILIIANKLKLAQKFLKGIRDYLVQIPRWCWGEEYINDPDKNIFGDSGGSKSEIELPNGCQVIAVATSEDALRGYTPTYLIFDEAAFIDRGDEVYAAAMSSCATGGKAILISTPNGMDPLYYKTYEEARAKRNAYNIIEMRWYQDPRYNKDLRWRRPINEEATEFEEVPEVEFTYESYERMIAEGYKPTSSWYENFCGILNNNKRKIAQELDVSFLGSGANVIDDEDIHFHEKNNAREPELVSGNESEYWLWEEPQEGHTYMLGCDVSRGDGEDFSTIVIIDITTMEQVFEYQGKMKADKLGEEVFKYGTMYNAFAVVDITGGRGDATVLKLLELGYKSLYYHDGKKNLGKVKDMEKYVRDKDKMPGFQAQAVREPMITKFEEMVRLNAVKIRSKRLIDEMKTFIFKNGKPDHMDGYHDDLIMALAMVLYVHQFAFKELEKLESKTKAMLSGWVSSASRGSNVDPNSAFTPKSMRKQGTTGRPNFDHQTRKNMQDPNGDYLWLFSGMK